MRILIRSASVVTVTEDGLPSGSPFFFALRQNTHLTLQGLACILSLVHSRADLDNYRKVRPMTLAEFIVAVSGLPANSEVFVSLDSQEDFKLTGFSVCLPECAEAGVAVLRLQARGINNEYKWMRDELYAARADAREREDYWKTQYNNLSARMHAASGEGRFTVILDAVGEKKIQVIQAIREATQFGLKKAKDLADLASAEGNVDVCRFALAEDANACAAVFNNLGAVARVEERED